MEVTITAERPDAPDAVVLIGDLDAHLERLYAPESRHGLSVERLLAENVDFFVLRADGAAVACGAIQFVDDAYGEIKRMWVTPAFRGRGFAKRMLRHLEDHARARGFSVLRLETGTHQREAIGLYERSGFRRIPPFGPYFDDPVSLCYERRLEPAGQAV